MLLSVCCQCNELESFSLLLVPAYDKIVMVDPAHTFRLDSVNPCLLGIELALVQAEKYLSDRVLPPDMDITDQFLVWADSFVNAGSHKKQCKQIIDDLSRHTRTLLHLLTLSVRTTHTGMTLRSVTLCSVARFVCLVRLFSLRMRAASIHLPSRWRRCIPMRRSSPRASSVSTRSPYSNGWRTTKRR